jgi:hypothetical protein
LANGGSSFQNLHFFKRIKTSSTKVCSSVVILSTAVKIPEVRLPILVRPWSFCLGLAGPFCFTI